MQFYNYQKKCNCIFPDKIIDYCNLKTLLLKVRFLLKSTILGAMVMKWSKYIYILVNTNRRAVFCVALLAACGLSMHALVARLGSVTQCVFTFDNRLSSEVSEHIALAIEQHARAGNQYADIVADITQTFSCIDGIALHHCAPGTLHCTVTSVRPLIQVNDAYVVSDHGLLITPDCFSPMAMRSLRTMRVDDLNEHARMSDTFVATAKTLISGLLDQFDARWIDDKKMIMQEKAAPHFSIICNAQTVPDKEMLACCQQLKHDIASSKIRPTLIRASGSASSGGREISKTQQWSADIRFEHQIIASQGGVA